jgi:hypothetical protein
VRYGFHQEESHISGGINATKDFQDDRFKKLHEEGAPQLISDLPTSPPESHLSLSNAF